MEKVGSLSRVTLSSKRVTLSSTQGQPAPRTNFVISHINSSKLFIKKRKKSSLARGGSVWRVTLPPGTTLLALHIII